MPRPRSVSDDQILAATGQVLLREGPARFTLAHVAEACGLSPATLLQRFGSKHGLLVAFAKREALNAKEPFETARRRSDDPLEALRLALAHASRSLQTRQQVANSLALLTSDIADDELRAAAAEHARVTEREICALLREAAAFDDPEDLALTVHAAWQGAVLQWALRGEEPFESWLDRTLAPILGDAP